MIGNMKNKWKRILAVLVLLCIGIAGFCILKDRNKSVTKSIFAMDTYMDITAYGRNSEKAVDAALEEIYRLDALLSTGSDTSEVTRLNQNKTGELSEDCSYLLQCSMELWESTKGAFDITIYPIMRAWGFVGKDYRVPSEEEIAELLHYVDASKIVFNVEMNGIEIDDTNDIKTNDKKIYNEKPNRVELPEQVEIDFGGIAKGYTSTRVAQIMEEYGVQSAILNLGGNVQTVGAKTDGSMWKVAVQSPYDNIPYLGVISIEDKAVITSGGYERYFEENGNRYHHIIDPKTGKPAMNGLVSVTIVCEDGTLADGLSTALYVMGKDAAITYWRVHSEEFDAVLFDDAGMLYVTEGLEGFFSSELEYEIITVSKF